MEDVAGGAGDGERLCDTDAFTVHVEGLTGPSWFPAGAGVNDDPRRGTRRTVAGRPRRGRRHARRAPGYAASASSFAVTWASDGLVWAEPSAYTSVGTV